jgi:hypothetical protein
LGEQQGENKDQGRKDAAVQPPAQGNRILRSMVMVLMIVTVCIDKRLGGGFAGRTPVLLLKGFGFGGWRWHGGPPFHGAKGYSATRLGGH